MKSVEYRVQGSGFTGSRTLAHRRHTVASPQQGHDRRMGRNVGSRMKNLEFMV